jgi:hypothetical protein
MEVTLHTLNSKYTNKARKRGYAFKVEGKSRQKTNKKGRTRREWGKYWNYSHFTWGRKAKWPGGGGVGWESFWVVLQHGCRREFSRGK